jgi:hypothetical protein
MLAAKQRARSKGKGIVQPAGRKPASTQHGRVAQLAEQLTLNQ